MATARPNMQPDEHMPDWVTHIAFLTSRNEMAHAGARRDTIQFIHDKYEALKNQGKSLAARPIDESQIEYAEVSRHLWNQSPSARAFEDRTEEMAYHRQLDREKKGILDKDGSYSGKLNVGKEVIGEGGEDLGGQVVDKLGQVCVILLLCRALLSVVALVTRARLGGLGGVGGAAAASLGLRVLRFFGAQ